MPKLTTRKYAKRREMTWEYAKGVDDINAARPVRRTAAGQVQAWNLPPETAAELRKLAKN